MFGKNGKSRKEWFVNKIKLWFLEWSNCLLRCFMFLEDFKIVFNKKYFVEDLFMGLILKRINKFNV